MRTFSALVLAGSVLWVTACSPSSPEVDATASTDQAPTTPGATGGKPEVDVPVSNRLWFEPAGVSACGSGTDVVTVNWDASTIAGVAAVEISLVNGEGGETLFAATGPSGSKDTGPWAHAGTVMKLRDAATGRDLAKATIAGIPCEPGTNAG